MELDIWIPHHRLAIEYQGEQHFHNLVHCFGRGGDQLAYTDRDRVKHKKCAEVGISIIGVPYWWDSTSQSLEEIIKEYINS